MANGDENIQLNDNDPVNRNDQVNENQNEQQANENQNEQQVNPPEGENKENQANKNVSDDIYVEMFIEKLKTFNEMYKTKISKDKLVSTVSDAWKLLTDEDQTKKLEGKKQLNGLFDAILEHAFEVEKKAAYNESRFPEYAEIITSSNNLVRAAMFSFTDLYRDKSRAPLFAETAFGGMSGDEMVKLTEANGFWKLDQKSDEAWEIQSENAKEIANEWLTKKNPHQSMIDEMNDIIENNKNGNFERKDYKDVLNKLAAAEWLLINDDKMMLVDSNDPYQKTPRWDNRYWKAITSAREAMGIPKHISMRELIQGNYSVMQKTMQNVNYHKDQIETKICNPEKRAAIDSMEKQNEEFVIQSAKIAENRVPNDNNIKNMEMNGDRIRISIVEEDEYLKAKNMPRDMSTFVIEKSKEMSFEMSGKNNVV